MNFNFGDILSRAWKITWRHKILWILGILAGCGTQQGPNFNNSSYRMNDRANLPTGSMPQFMREFIQYLDSGGWVMIAIGILVLILVLVVINAVLSTIGRVGLVRGAVQADGEQTPVLSELFGGSWKYFWRSFWMWFLIGFPFAFASLAVVLAALGGMAAALAGTNNNQQLIGMLSVIPVLLTCMCCLGLLGLIAGLIAQQAQIAIVVEDLGTLAGLARGWEVFRANLGTVILMAVILGVLGWVASFLIGLPLLLILLPTMGAFFVSAIASNGTPSFAPLLVGIAVAILYIPISLVANGMVMTFTQSSWTLTYLQLTRPPQPPVEIVEANAQPL